MPMNRVQTTRGEVLVALVNSTTDWQIIVKERWYRIPVESIPKRFPPEVIAFYQTKVFREQAFAVRYFAEVERVDEVGRSDLFPLEIEGPKASRRYFKLSLGEVKELPEPIPSLRLRRIVFIPTTRTKLEIAEEINDLFDESPLEDSIWKELKHLSLPAERQFQLTYGDRYFMLDFAVFCRQGSIDIEADGDTWHSDKDRISNDNARNNALAAMGWKVLRFNGYQIREQMADYCIPEIVKTVNRLGGIDESKGPPRTYTVTKSGIVQQLGLFDQPPPYPKRTE
jgi:very-short-patch-repair endonuclease